MDRILDPIKPDDHPVDFHLSSDVAPENELQIINSSENFFYVSDENDEKYLNDIRKYLASSDSKKPKANATDEEKQLGPQQFARDLNGMNYQIGINQESSFRLEVGNKLDFVNKIKEVFGEAAFWNIAAIATQAFTVELAASMAKSYQQKYQIENLEDIAYGQPIKPECILEKKDESIKITFLVHLNLRSLDGPGIFYSGMKSVTMTFDDAITDWAKQSEAKLLEHENSQKEKNIGWFSYLFAFLSSKPVKEETSGQDFSFAAPSLRIEDTLFSAMHRTNIEDARNEVWGKMTLSQN